VLGASFVVQVVVLGRVLCKLCTCSTVKGQSRSDSLLLSPYHWAKLFRGVVAIVAVPMRFAVIC